MSCTICGYGFPIADGDAVTLDFEKAKEFLKSVYYYFIIPYFIIDVYTFFYSFLSYKLIQRIYNTFFTHSIILCFSPRKYSLYYNLFPII